jgi:hypothetical protein
MSLQQYTKLAWAAVPSLKEELTAGSGSSLKCRSDKAAAGSPLASHIDLAGAVTSMSSETDLGIGLHSSAGNARNLRVGVKGPIPAEDVLGRQDASFIVYVSVNGLVRTRNAI